MDYNKFFEDFYKEDSYSPVNAIQKPVDPLSSEFQLMKSNKIQSIQSTLKDKLCKGVVLQVYVQSLPMDTSYKCQHPSEYEKDVDNFFKHIDQTPVEYITGCKDSVVKDQITEAVKEVEKAVQKTVEELPADEVETATVTDDDNAMVDSIIDTLKDDDDFKRVTEKISDVVKQNVMSEMDKASKDLAADTESDKAAKDQITEDDPTTDDSAEPANTTDTTSDLEAMANESVFHRALTKLYQENTIALKGKYPQNVVFEMSLAQVTKERTLDIINFAFHETAKIKDQTYNNRIFSENTIIKI